MQGESRATEAREQQERAALLLQEQEKSSYWSPRAGSSMNNTTGLARRDSVSRRGSMSNDAARPTILSRSNSRTRHTSISQPNPPPLNTQVPQASGQTHSTRTHAPPPVSFPANFNPRGRRPSFSSQDLPFASNRLSGSFENQNPFTPVVPVPVSQPAVTIHQDPWDARNMREALPAPRQPSDGRYTLQRRGEAVIKASGTHSAARQATRAMGRVAGFEDDYATDSSDEPTHGHGRKRHV
jgi:hypothetical protein